MHTLTIRKPKAGRIALIGGHLTKNANFKYIRAFAYVHYVCLINTY